MYRFIPALCLLLLTACGGSDELYDFDGDGSLDAEDCAPEDPTIYPGATDPYGDEVDQNCDDGDGIDSDADGYPANEDLEPEHEALYDCDDTRANIHPGANDNVGDQVDSNCDGHDGTDNDGDGYASLNSEGDDCDDTREDIHPGADDPYDDGLDSNCDGGDGIDNDGDGYPANKELVGSEFYDCNDANAAVHPGAEEVPDDGIDNDCDGAELVDGDGDGYYEGFDDCDDADPNTYLGAPELPDGIDNDCDTLVDEGTELADDDGDGYCEGWDIDDDGSLDCSGLAEPGDCDDDNTMLTPADLDGDLVSSCDGDCDDANAQRSPSLAELCDGLDNDCDLTLPLNEQDIDGDGYMPCTGDCDDLVATTYLGAAEACNAVDDDCDGSTDEGFDIDGDGVTSCGEDGLLGTPDDDCDDGNAAVSPALTEACDGLDNDCDLLVPSNEDDLDLDGFMVCEADCNDADPLLTPADGDADGASSCAGDCDDSDAALNLLDGDADGATSCAGDCDDSDAANYPTNTEVCDGQDNDCDAATSAAGGEDDLDGDSDPSCSDCDDDDPDYNSFDDDGDSYTPCGVDGVAGTSDDDCDDSDYWINPSVTDSAGDGIDQNCDEVDGFDGDGDGYASLASLGEDCNDGDATEYPGAPELCNGEVEDCDGTLPGDEDDVDGDGYVECAGWTGDPSILSGDCGPVDAGTYPGATEQCSGIDNDCDGSTDDEEADDDEDGQSPCDGDCDDGDPNSVVAGQQVVTQDGSTFLSICTGTFEMGCGAGQSSCSSNEYPVHNVTLTNNFWMSETEVTQGQWQSLMGNNPSGFGSCGATCPVERANWWEAVAFANAVSTAEGLAECYTPSGCTGTAGVDLDCTGVTINSVTGSPYDCEGYRLPTEAEWEYAARAGTDLLYAGSDTVGDVAWYDGNSSGMTHAVATKAANAWGLYDMTGNVYEWTWDWYGWYGSSSPSTDPEGPSSGSYRVFRGGCWFNDASYLRVAARYRSAPDYRYYYRIGFRLSRTIP